MYHFNIIIKHLISQYRCTSKPLPLNVYQYNHMFTQKKKKHTLTHNHINNSLSLSHYQHLQHVNRVVRPYLWG